MYFKEIIVQGLFGVTKGVRLPLQEGLNEPLLPPPLDAGHFKSLVSLVLYPKDAIASGDVLIDTSGGDPVRLGAVLEVGDREHKLIWDLREDSLQVMVANKPVAAGREQVQRLWSTRLGLLPYKYASAIHYHEFSAPEFDHAGSQDKTAELVHEYRRSLSIERVEQDIGNCEGKLRDLEKTENPAVKIERALDKVIDRLGQFKRVPEMSDTDREFLDDFTPRNKGMQAELDEIQGNFTANDQQLARMGDTPLLKDVLFWVGMVIGIGSVMAALVLSKSDPKLRAIALGNAVGFGLALGALLKHLSEHEVRSNIGTFTRNLKDRRTELEKTLEREDLRLKRLLKRYEASSPEQIMGDAEMKAKLKAKRSELEGMLKSRLNDPEVVKLRNDLKETKLKLIEVKKERAKFGDFVMPTYELRPELERRGVSVDTLKPLDFLAESPMIEYGRSINAVPGTRSVSAEDLEIFNKLIEPMTGGKEVMSIKDGVVMINGLDGEDVPLRELETRRQAPYLRAIGIGLLAAHRRGRPADSDAVSFLLLEDPWGGLSRNERVRFYTLVKDLAKSFQIIVPKMGD